MKFFLTGFSLILFSIVLKAQTLPPAFVTCPSTGFQVVNNPSDFQTVNLATGATTTVATFPIYVNAIGYNPNDNRIYGIRQGTPLALVVIGSDYTYDTIPTSGAALLGSVVGDVSPSGILWCFGGTKIYTVDCNPSDGANFGKVTIIGNKPAVAVLDWSFPANDTTKIYSVASDGSLVYVSTSNLSVHTVMAAATVPAGSYGATYFDNSGNFYAKSNTSGIIYKFINATTSTPTVITFSTSSTSGQNDGARCPNAPAPVIADYGDAPDSYGTYASSGGPFHLLPSPNPDLAQIYLGSAVTIDQDGNPSAAANLDSDDGVSSFSAIYGGTSPSSISSYSVVVKVHNATASAANVGAWIDWNNNGTFDSSERVAARVPANFTGSDTLRWSNITLTGPNGTAGTYARVRISTDTMTSPLGMASNGEVEDYYIAFSSVLPVSISGFSAARVNTAAHLSWVTYLEQNNKGFAIERSSDGTLFHQIDFVASQAAGGTSSYKIQYNYYDTRPVTGINYYRLKQINSTGEVVVSQVAKVIWSNSDNAVTIYPNPAKDRLSIDGLKGNETLLLYNATGQLIKREKAGGVLSVLDISHLTLGVYRLTITDESGKIITKKIVKQ